MPLEAVQAQAGHASIESTRIYLHLADDWLASQYRRAAEVIDAQVFAGADARHRADPTTVASPASAGCDEHHMPHGSPDSTSASGPLRCPPGPDRGRPTGRWRPRCAPTWTRSPCVLRPGSVGDADLALRSLATYLAEPPP